MAWRKYSPEDVIHKLREADVLQPVPVAVSDVIRIIDAMTVDKTGSFWSYDGNILS